MYFLARVISGLRRCGSSSTAAIVRILLLPPTKSRIMTANSVTEQKDRKMRIHTSFHWQISKFEFFSE